MRKLLVEYDAGRIIKEKEKINENFTSETKIGCLSFPITEPLYIPAILQKADVENKNGRIYPRALLEREVNKYNDYINMGNSLGNTDHPEESVVSLKENPHRIVKIWWEGNIVMGTLELLVSPMFKEKGFIQNTADQIANLIYNYGVTVGISSRGVGSLDETGGKKYVMDDFELICWDLVHSPSTYNAFLYNDTSLMNKLEKENVNNNIDTSLNDDNDGTDDIMEKIKRYMKY